MSSVFVYCKYKVVYFINQIFRVKFFMEWRKIYFVGVGDFIFKIVMEIKRGCSTFLLDSLLTLQQRYDAL